MKHLYALVLLTLVFSNPCFSQLQNDEPQCSQKCSHASFSSRQEQANYYQYPSMANYDIKYLKLDLSAEAGSEFLSGTALTVATALQALDSFNIELKDNMTVDSVYINGTRRIFGRGANFLFVPLSPALPAGSTVSALVYYNGTPSNGIYSGINGTNNLTYTATLSESYQAREWFPAKQILSDKIDSADIWVKTDAAFKVGSNGLLVAVVDSPGNKKQYQWRSRYPMSYYMPSIAIGNYIEYTNYAKPTAMAPDSIPVLHYCVDNTTYFNSVKPNMDVTPPLIEEYSDLFGLYPFKDEKYGHSLAYIGGGMEHQTMTTLSGFGTILIAHELGHQWWGDNVTCKTWNHIWLNEGFASYCEYLAIEKLPALFPAYNTTTWMQNIHTNVMSQPGGSVFVPDASLFDENRIFSGRLSYNKGEAIIHTLRFEMQDDNLFFQTLKNYHIQFKNSVATADDFKQVAETTSGKNFTDFFNEWYYGEGYPTFNITYLTQGTDSIILDINQTVSMPGITPFFKGLYEFTITSLQGDTTVKVYMTSNNQQFKFKYNKTPNGVIVDPNNWVLNATGNITNGGTVIVNLDTFETTEHDCTATLRWKMSNEENVSRYEIEYSTDGTNFTGIATINSTNSASETIHEYNYDLGTGHVHYFRVRIINLNGSYLYTPVTSVTKNCAGSFSVNIKPNPVAGTLYLSITQPTDGNTIIRIYDSRGALVYNGSQMLMAGVNNVQVPLAQSFSHGTYMLKAINSNVVINKKFVKL